MNVYTIIGIILVAVGGLLAAYGQHRASDETERRRDAKFAEYFAKLDNAKGLPPDMKAIVLDSIDRDFDSWAKKFAKTRDRNRLPVQETLIQKEQGEITASDAARPVFNLLLTSIRDYLRAYNAETGSKFEAELPELPDNFMGSSTYVGYVSFKPNAVRWQIHIWPTNDLGQPVPMLAIHIAPDGHSFIGSEGNMVYAIQPYTKVVVAQNERAYPPFLDGMTGRFPFGEAAKGLQRSIQRLLESQILALKQP